MPIKQTVPTNSGDYLQFGNATTPVAAQVGGYEDSTGNGHLELYTTASGTVTERVRVTSAGDFGIGLTPATRLDVGKTSRYTFDVANAYTLLTSLNLAGSAFADSYYNATQHIWQNSGTEQARITSAGVFQFNSGYGSSAAAYGCRAWVRFNGSTGAISGSGNVTSVTRNATGDYSINFTNAMPDANYVGQGSAIQSASGNGPICSQKAGSTATTTVFPAFLTNDAGTAQDVSVIMWAFHR